jgi:multidrug efflux pump subunit AcrA (membrane-fusion protein)
MKQMIVLFLFFLLLVPACRKDKSNLITYDLKRRDYIETLDALGTVQAVNNFTILAPVTPITNLLQLTHLVKDGTHVKKGDTICVFNVPELSDMIESYKVDLENMEGDLKKLTADNAMQLSLLNAQVETNKAETAISMLDSLKMKFATPVDKKLIALEMEKANIEKNKLQKKLTAQKRINNSELIKMSSRIMMQKNRLQMFQKQFNSLKIASPVDGIVMHVQNYRLEGGAFMFGDIEEGSSTLSNMSVLQIPDMKTMQITVEVSESDYKKIQNGQKVLINVESASDLHTTGKIKRKSLQRANSQIRTAIKTYEVVISVDSCHSRMKPGLSALCRIIIDQVKDTIVVPVASIFEKDSLKIVYVAQGKKFIPVTVETGTSNSSFSIVSKGLTGNETIALTMPSHNMIKEERKIKPEKTGNKGSDKKDSVSIKTVSKESSF